MKQADPDPGRLAIGLEHFKRNFRRFSMTLIIKLYRLWRRREKGKGRERVAETFFTSPQIGVTVHAVPASRSEAHCHLGCLLLGSCKEAS